ncbi:uncharacterized protein [Phyllobates terribilis]|uniref:uncharacterized protein n=1 Tax=Phyllobates terribilis TaxID=111132 RepID=UPI003CCB3B60
MEEPLIREVFHANFKEEESRLLWALSLDFNTIALDTEYPGTIISTPQFADEVERYRDVKFNVERTRLIQVGFTLYNPITNELAGVWQFNLSGFDPTHHVHSPKAIDLLRKSGIDFSENNTRGVNMWQFANMLKRIRLGFSNRIQWVTFHGLYDVAYLLAAMNSVWKLPEDIRGFSEAAGEFFSGGIFDVKCMARHNSCMGLETLAATFGIEREQGWAHQAGSDSLLTAKTFVRTWQWSLVNTVEHYRGRLFGISLPIGI